MNEIERIADQLKRAFEGRAWHGPAVLELLEHVSAAQAARRPIAGAHSIWEIVLHMATWEDAVRRRALGETVTVTDAQDWPAVTATDQQAWEEARAKLVAGHHALRDVLAALPERRLDEPLVPDGSTGYVQLHGVVQHDLYHAGQIAVLKKAKAEAKASVKAKTKTKPKTKAKASAKGRARRPARKRRRVAAKRRVARKRRR